MIDLYRAQSDLSRADDTATIVRRIRHGCRACLTMGCLLVILACALAVALSILFVTRTRAAAADARHFALLVDQSNSVVQSTPKQQLARATTLALLDAMRDDARDDDTARVLFFGAQMATIAPTSALSDAGLAARVQTAFDRARGLGNTPLADTLAAVLHEGILTTDVIVITDGVPEPVDNSIAARDAYADRLRDLAAQYTARGVTLSFLLVGADGRGDWLAVWHQVAAKTHGIAASITTAADITSAVRQLPILHPTSPPTPAPTPTTAAPTIVLTATPTLIPTVTPAPMATALTPTPMPTALMVVTPAVTSAARADKADAPIVPWLVVLVGAALAGLGALGVFGLKRGHAKSSAAEDPSDEGVLEIYSPDQDEVQRVELGALGLGEVWTIGSGAQCQIRVAGAGNDVELALVLTPEGPQIESRGASGVLWFDGRTVKKHLLYDGDRLYLGRLVLYYHNFFRQRVMEEDF